MIVVVNNDGSVSNTFPNTKQMSGESIPGDLNSWDYLGTDPNHLLRYTHDILCQRATTLFHTHAPVSAAIKKTTMYAVGHGLLFRSQPDWETLGMTKEAAKAWGMKFQKLIHYAFRTLNFYEKQAILFRTSLIMGDSVLMFDRGYDEGGMPFDLIDVGGDIINFRATPKRGEKVTLGIVHDNFMRKSGAYFVDGKKVDFVDENGDQNFVQFYFKEMARQLRGYPLTYKIIAAAKNNDRWWDATLARVVMETMILGTVNESNADDAYKQSSQIASEIRGESGQQTGLATEGNVMESAPGTVLSFGNDSGGMKFTDLKAPANNFDKMQNAYLEIVGMATDVPPEVILSKYSTSYTAHKGALNDFVKSYMQKRHTFVNSICYKVVLELAKYFFMNDLIEMPHPLFFENAIIQQATISGNWLGPVPGQLNPLQEAKGDETAVLNAFQTRSDVATKYGNEWDNMILEWQGQESQWKAQSEDEKTKTLIKDDIKKTEEGDQNDDQGGDE